MLGSGVKTICAWQHQNNYACRPCQNFYWRRRRNYARSSELCSAVGIMLGCRNHAWPSKYCSAATKLCGGVKLSLLAVLKLCLTALKKLCLEIIINGVIVIMLGCIIEIMLGSIVGTGTFTLYPRQCMEKMRKNTFSSGKVRQISSVRSFIYKYNKK